MSNTTRTVKPENWAVLAGTINEVLGVPGNQDFAYRAAKAFRDGVPGEYLQPVVAQCKRCIDRSYNGFERARAASLLETLANYGLITSVQA
jgi:hypothetical protein